MEKIILGLSGGVDSSVAAHLLKTAGWDVTGVFLVTGCDGGKDAESVARALGIGFRRVDVRESLEKFVKEPFTQAYLRGETPNPCIMCNPSVKFPTLFGVADEIGAKYAATGHYARTEIVDGRARLLRGRHENDQSYMLSSLTQEQLLRIKFPLGNMNKAEIRAAAREIGLSVADKPDSMEICFIPDGDYGRFIEERVGGLPAGDFVDPAGNVLGRHRGIHRYTVGQRRGLGTALGRRMFVSRIDPEKNQVTLSEGDDIFVRELTLPEVNWISIERPCGPVRCTVRVRHSKTETPAELTPISGGARLVFETPVRAPTAGQSAVMYDGDIVLAAGIIV